MTTGAPSLFVMRHGPAADDSITGLDDDRILTPAGRQRVERMAEALVAHGAVPSALVTSPLARASETANLVARTLRRHGREVPVVVARELAPGRLSARTAASLIAKASGPVCLVGHEPCLSQFVAEVAAVHLPRGFDKAMIVALVGEFAHLDRFSVGESAGSRSPDDPHGTSPRVAVKVAWVLDPLEHGG